MESNGGTLTDEWNNGQQWGHSGKKYEQLKAMLVQLSRLVDEPLVY